MRLKCRPWLRIMIEPTFPTRQPYRILVIAPNWLGDLVMSTPLLTLLAAARQEVAGGIAVTVAVRRRWLPLLVDDPRVDALMSVERVGRHAGFRGLPKLAADWRAGGYDAVVICPPSLHVAVAARLAGIPLRCGYRTDARGWLLDPGLVPYPRGQRHYSGEMMHLGDVLLARLAQSNDRQQVAAPPSRINSERYLPSLPGCAAITAADPGEGPPIWILAPGTTYGEAKVWPVERVVEFVSAAVTEAAVRVVLLGDATASDFVGGLRRRLDLPWRTTLSGAAGVVDLVGRTDLRAVVALLKTSTAFVGNDSGLMHLAAALSVATVGLFGSSNPAWTAPRGPRATAITAVGFDCQPCYRKRCPEPHFCLDSVDGAQVLARLRALIAADGAVAPSPGAAAAEADHREARW